MSEPMRVNARFVTQVTIKDPDTGEPVEMEVWKDPTSDGLFAIDASFLGAVAEEIPSPFNPDTTLFPGAHKRLPPPS